MTSAPEPRSLLARPIALNSSDFRAIQGWQFPDEPFYLRQIQRMLVRDIPHYVLFEGCTIWVYIDPQAGKDPIGFGTISVSNLYSRYTHDLPHCYIPLLSIKPDVKSFGYGQSIVEHLVAEAAVVVRMSESETISDYLFLDVYTANEKASRLYDQKCQFVILNPDAPILDPDENNEPYVIMARKVSTSGNP
jgi:hypothetical protein